MSEIKAGNIRKGMYLLFKNEPYLVTKTDFMSPGKGSAFMRVKMRSVKTASTQEFTYKSAESVEQLDVTNQEMQFLYQDGQDIVFMNPRSYEQVSIDGKLVEDILDLLTPEVTVYIMFYNDDAIGATIPPKVTLTVTMAQDAASGNTVGQARKPVTLETGLEVQAPVFVKTGDKLVIDTATKSYVSRAN
jgi:elongation factor P